jgi:hypothetical protein
MRVLAEEVHMGVRVSIFHMNQKYIVKLEKGPFEQTYKLSEFDFSFADTQEVLSFVKMRIVDQSLDIFDQMIKLIDEI